MGQLILIAPNNMPSKKVIFLSLCMTRNVFGVTSRGASENNVGASHKSQCEALNYYNITVVYY